MHDRTIQVVLAMASRKRTDKGCGDHPGVRLRFCLGRRERENKIVKIKVKIDRKLSYEDH